MIADAPKLLLLAIRSYTQWPLGARLTRWVGESPALLATAQALLPLIGWPIGVIGALGYIFAAQALPHSASVFVAVVLTTLVSGAVHEAGLARAFAAAGQRRDRVRSPWIGQADGQAGFGHGAIALILTIGLRMEALALLDPSWISLALITGHPLSRACALVAMAAGRRAKALGRASGLAPSRAGALFGLLPGLAPMFLAAWWFDQTTPMLWGAIPALMVLAVLRRRLRQWRRIDPASGIGVTQQLTEVAYYLGLLAWWTLGGEDDVAGAEEPPDDSPNDSEPEQPE